jgi:hypothetical protein
MRKFLAILLVMRRALLVRVCNKEKKAGLSDGNNQGIVG